MDVLSEDWPGTLRLWADDAHCRGDDGARAAYAALADAMERLEAETIERCSKVVEDLVPEYYGCIETFALRRAAKRIRALAEKVSVADD